MRHSVELTLARLAVRQLAGSRRSLWALALVALPILLAAIMSAEAAGADDAMEEFGELFQILIVPALLPIVALVVGTSVFGAEVDDGTITYVLGKPVARWRIVLTRIVVAGLATAAVVAPATLVAGLVAMRRVPGGAAEMALGCAVAVAAGSLLYCAFFVALSLSTRRALVAGLAYVVVWEGALSRTFGGTRALSIREYTNAFAEALAGVPAKVMSATLPLETALPMAAAVAALVTAHAIRRLRSFEIGEAA